jgi:ferredoxin
VTVERGCIGSGSCVGVAPDRFAIGEDGKAHPVATEVAPDEVVLDAAAQCPVEAIIVRDLATGELIDI